MNGGGGATYRDRKNSAAKVDRGVIIAKYDPARAEGAADGAFGKSTGATIGQAARVVSYINGVGTRNDCSGKTSSRCYSNGTHRYITCKSAASASSIKNNFIVGTWNDRSTRAPAGFGPVTGGTPVSRPCIDPVISSGPGNAGGHE